VSVPNHERDRVGRDLLDAARPDKAAVAIGLKIIGLAALNLFLQILVLEGGKYAFLASPEFSRSFHSFFSWAEDLTPALRRLQAAYRQPLYGVGFSQAFSIYLITLASFIPYSILVCVLALKRRFNNVRWSLWGWRDYSLIALFWVPAIMTFVTFFFGPLTMNYRTFRGGTFIGSVTHFVPAAQFFFLFILVVYFTMGASLGTKT